jgi:DNA-binding NarL/FixJ family response regulator
VVISIRVLSSMLVAQVKDNGVGFSAKRVLSSLPTFGLRTMRERIQQAGGYLEIASRPGEGTRLKATFSLATPAMILTKREREVLRLLVEGSTNRAIAEALSVSIETVKSHVHHIMQKMHAKDRTQAAVIATRQRWL